MAVDYSKIQELLGADADGLLNYSTPKISKDNLHVPGGDFIDRVWINSDRTPQVLRSLQTLFDNGRLAKTGYLSILPVDQGIEHSAGASFAPNPIYFDPENIVKLAIEGGCNAVASTLGVLGMCARKYAHQIRFANIRQAFDMGAAGVGATIYFGSEESKRQIQEVTQMFEQAHELGMFT